MFGNKEENSLFGRPGVDELFGRAGNDFINAYDEGTHDTVGGGEGTADECKFDKAIDSVSGCEKEIAVEK